MKRVMYIFLVLIILASYAYADYSAICTGQNVNVRVEAKSKASSIGKLKKNDEFTVVSELGDWCYIMCNLGEGYIPSRYVQEISTSKADSSRLMQASKSKVTKDTASKSDSVISTNAQTSKSMTVSVKASCSNKNHVGNNWTYYFEVNGVECKKGSSKKINLTTGDKVKFYSEITENDKYPDEGIARTEYVISEDDLRKGFKIEQQIEVTEDRGRYAGSNCYWDIVFTVKP